MSAGAGFEHCLILPQPVHNLGLFPPAAIAASAPLLGQQQLLFPWGIWGAGGWMGEAERAAEGLAGCRVGASTVQPFQSKLQGCKDAGCRDAGTQDAGMQPSPALPGGCCCCCIPSQHPKCSTRRDQQPPLSNWVS